MFYYCVIIVVNAVDVIIVVIVVAVNIAVVVVVAAAVMVAAAAAAVVVGGSVRYSSDSGLWEGVNGPRFGSVEAQVLDAAVDCVLSDDVHGLSCTGGNRYFRIISICGAVQTLLS